MWKHVVATLETGPSSELVKENGANVDEVGWVKASAVAWV
jgi:hypothetical protein